jgi:hypothetical protein
MPSPISFVFTAEERQAAMEEGMRRQSVNEAQRLRGRNGGASFGSKALEIHLLGAAGELAVASHLGMKDLVYKETEAKRGSCDLPGIDIKTRSKHQYDLIVQKNEPPEKNMCWLQFKTRPLLFMDGSMGERLCRKSSGLIQQEAALHTL